MANSPYQQQILGLEKQRETARKLREQAMNAPESQMVSGWYVPPSWTQYASQALRGYMAHKDIQSAEEQQKQLEAGRQTDLENIMKSFGPGGDITQASPKIMAHALRYGPEAATGIAALQNAMTGAENARMKRRKLEDEGKQAQAFMETIFPGQKYQVNAADEDYQLMPISNISEAAQTVGDMQPPKPRINVQAAEQFGFMPDQLQRLQGLSALNPRLAEQMVLAQFKASLKPPPAETTARMREFQAFQAMTPEQQAAYSKFRGMGTPSTNVNVSANLPSTAEAAKTAGKEFGKFAVEATQHANNAYDVASDIGMIVEGLKGMGGGPVAEAKAFFGQILPAGSAWGQMASMQELASTVQAKIAPQMRAIGSGSTSDMEMKMFLRAVPTIATTESGRLLMQKYAQRVADRTQIRAEIVNKIEQSGRLPTPKEIATEMKSRMGDAFFDAQDRAFFGIKPAAPKPAGGAQQPPSDPLGLRGR